MLGCEHGGAVACKCCVCARPCRSSTPRTRNHLFGFHSDTGDARFVHTTAFNSRLDTVARSKQATLGRCRSSSRRHSFVASTATSGRRTFSDATVASCQLRVRHVIVRYSSARCRSRCRCDGARGHLFAPTAAPAGQMHLVHSQQSTSTTHARTSPARLSWAPPSHVRDAQSLSLREASVPSSADVRLEQRQKTQP